MWPFAKPENREAYTDAITAALFAAASDGNVPPSVEALGAVEAAAGLWSRAFASATVEPQTAATMPLTPSVLAAIGRGLAARGEVVGWKRAAVGRSPGSGRGRSGLVVEGFRIGNGRASDSRNDAAYAVRPGRHRSRSSSPR